MFLQTKICISFLKTKIKQFDNFHADTCVCVFSSNLRIRFEICFMLFFARLFLDSFCFYSVKSFITVTEGYFLFGAFCRILPFFCNCVLTIRIFWNDIHEKLIYFSFYFYNSNRKVAGYQETQSGDGNCPKTTRFTGRDKKIVMVSFLPWNKNRFYFLYRPNVQSFVFFVDTLLRQTHVYNWYA